MNTLFRPFCLATACAALSAACAFGTGAKVALPVRGPLPLKMQLAGQQELKCRSQWHTVDVKSKIGGAFFLTRTDLRSLLPPKASPGDSWVAGDAVTRSLGTRLFHAIKYEHSEPVAYERWRGKLPIQQQLSARGRLVLRLASIESSASLRTAKCIIQGGLALEESGRMRNRQGPNTWSATWTLHFQGTLTLDLDRGRVVEIILSCKGRVSGEYGNQNNPQKDPWDAALDVKLTGCPLARDLREKLLNLMDELGHDGFARRQKATDEAKKLAPPHKALLVAALLDSDDPELRYRAELIEPPAKKPPAQEPGVPAQEPARPEPPILLRRIVPVKSAPNF